ncbi:ATP-grasp domain-containing protein [Streptomyces caniscabiei]|uniref:ATP-grasp domain-containing protein n=1 Tax=Streptomyces caniscabiei TaxID=2746961 RepID=UPI000A3986C0|nr:ATP-grasp domain-containing protein [Streptomyces caniscabiei]
MLLFIESTGTGAGMSYVKWAVDNDVDAAYVTDQPIEVAKARLGGEVVEELERRERVYQVPSTLTGDVPSALVNKIRDVGGPMGVICSLDRSVEFAAVLAEQVGAPYPSPYAVRTIRDKSSARQFYTEVGVPNIRWCTPKSPEELVAFVEQLDGPVVLKNTLGAGSYNVRLVRDTEEAVAGFAELSGGNPYLGGELLAEEYVRGPVYSLETLIVDGRCHHLGVTDRQIGPNPAFCEVSYSFPVQLPPSVAASMRSTVETCVTALGIAQGMLHTEFAVRAEDVVIIEINIRPAGAGIPLMMNDCLESPVAEILAAAALGKDLPSLRQNGRASTTMTVYPPVGGKLRALHGIEEARRSPFVVQVMAVARIGEEVSPPVDFRGWLCQIRTVADSLNLSFNAAVEAARDVWAESE